MTNENKLYVMVAGKKMYPAMSVAKILLGLTEESKVSVLVKQSVTGTLTYMRTYNYLNPEDYVKIYDGAKELADSGINIRGKIRYVFLYTKKAIYKVADYKKKEKFRQNANRYFVDCEYDQVFPERFVFNRTRKHDHVILDNELHFSSECIGAILGSAEQLKLFTLTREKLNSFSKVLEFITSIHNMERKIENLIKVHDYISALTLKDKDVYLEKINDVLNDKQINGKVVAQNIKNSIVKQPSAAFTEVKLENPLVTSDKIEQEEDCAVDASGNTDVLIKLQNPSDFNSYKLKSTEYLTPSIGLSHYNKSGDTDTIPLPPSVDFMDNNSSNKENTKIEKGEDDIGCGSYLVEKALAWRNAKRPVFNTTRNAYFFGEDTEKNHVTESAYLNKKVQVYFKDGTTKLFDISQDAKHSIKFGSIVEVTIEDGDKEKVLMFKSDDVSEIKII